jgi:hypothetical protein
MQILRLGCDMRWQTRPALLAASSLRMTLSFYFLHTIYNDDEFPTAAAFGHTLAAAAALQQGK